MDWVKKIIKDCITEKDNLTVCPVRVLSVTAGFLVVIGFVLGWAFTVWITRHFDAMLFATTSGVMIGTVTGAVSAAVTVKAAATETSLPKANMPQQVEQKGSADTNSGH